MLNGQPVIRALHDFLFQPRQQGRPDPLSAIRRAHKQGMDVRRLAIRAELRQCQTDRLSEEMIPDRDGGILKLIKLRQEPAKARIGQRRIPRRGRGCEYNDEFHFHLNDRSDSGAGGNEVL
jgi:hypothetical protein